MPGWKPLKTCFLATVLIWTISEHTKCCYYLSSTGGCVKYLLTGKGDFKLEKKRYPTQKQEYYIANLELKERTSFYKCTPEEVKYGVDLDGKSWWVDKGCEGIFEVRECLDETAKKTSGNCC